MPDAERRRILVVDDDEIKRYTVTRILEKGEPLTYDLVGEERGAPMSKVGQAVVAELGKLL